MESLELDIELTDKQQEFLGAMDQYRELLFGGGRGGGKSRGLRSCHIIRRIRYPRSKGVIWRRTFPELERNHIRPLFAELPQLRQYYNEQKRVLTLPNGSTEEFCYAENRRDLTKVQGAECDDLGLEEAGDWNEDEYEIMLATNRSTLYAPRAQCTANPGGIGHQWLKKRFITEPGPTRKFISSLLDDNPALKDSAEYRQTLASIKNPVLRKAWLEGDWDVQAGQFFDNFRRDVHVVKAFDVPKHWNRFGSYDYGYNHPAAWFWFADDEDGNVYVYREHCKAKMSIKEQAAIVNGFADSRRIPSWQAGLDCFAHKKSNDPTIAEEFAKLGVVLKAANVARKLGAAQIRSRLEFTDTPDGKRTGPRVFIFDTCPVLIDHLQRMVHNPDDVEDVLKVDAVEGDLFTGDDAYDSFRYGIMSRPVPTPRAKRQTTDRYHRERSQRPSAWTT
jgi:phage terminase large subunit